MSLKCSVYIATSIDGFIARADDNIDWLDDEAYTMSETEDFGYGEFIADIDTLVMGRRSFEKVLTFDNWPYGEMPVIVLSSQPLDIPDSLKNNVRQENLEPQALVDLLESEGRRHLYIDGGETIRRFLRAGLIDDITITQIPVLLGAGLPLFGETGNDIPLLHERTQAFENGFVQTTYRISPKS